MFILKFNRASSERTSRFSRTSRNRIRFKHIWNRMERWVCAANRLTVQRVSKSQNEVLDCTNGFSVFKTCLKLTHRSICLRIFVCIFFFLLFCILFNCCVFHFVEVFLIREKVHWFVIRKYLFNNVSHKINTNRFVVSQLFESIVYTNWYKTLKSTFLGESKHFSSEHLIKLSFWLKIIILNRATKTNLWANLYSLAL